MQHEITTDYSKFTLINHNAVSVRVAITPYVRMLCSYPYKYFQSIIAEVTGKGRPLEPMESIEAITTRLSLEIQTIRAKGESIESSEFYDLSSKVQVVNRLGWLVQIQSVCARLAFAY